MMIAAGAAPVDVAAIQGREHSGDVKMSNGSSMPRAVFGKRERDPRPNFSDREVEAREHPEIVHQPKPEAAIRGRERPQNVRPGDGTTMPRGVLAKRERDPRPNFSDRDVQAREHPEFAEHPQPEMSFADVGALSGTENQLLKKPASEVTPIFNAVDLRELITETSTVEADGAVETIEVTDGTQQWPGRLPTPVEPIVARANPSPSTLRFHEHGERVVVAMSNFHLSSRWPPRRSPAGCQLLSSRLVVKRHRRVVNGNAGLEAWATGTCRRHRRLQGEDGCRAKADGMWLPPPYELQCTRRQASAPLFAPPWALRRDWRRVRPPRCPLRSTHHRRPPSRVFALFFTAYCSVDPALRMSRLCRPDLLHARFLPFSVDQRTMKHGTHALVARLRLGRLASGTA
nr:predicted protein [Mycena chlorophos]